jgi:hypothetical protein
VQFLVLLALTFGALVVFAIGPLVGVLHAFFRSDWQPIGGRNVIWALLMLIPFVWIGYLVFYLITRRPGPSFDDE